MNFENEMQSRVDAINQLLKCYLPEQEGLQKTVLEAMSYSVDVGGKRLRPMFMQETYRMFGGTDSIVEPFMAAMEMIHTYSLVHDDLPAMDNDMYRRGKLTTHAVYGEAMGILTGDALLNCAFETVAKAFDMAMQREQETEDKTRACEVYRRIMQAYRTLAVRAGIFGMIGGQVVDVESDAKDAKPISREKLDFIYELKTGALLEASMEIGAILAGASEEELAVISEIASKVGLAFQIQDDILDVTSTLEVLGKPIGSDEKNNKSTYVTFEGLDKSRADVKRLSEEAVSLLDGLGRECTFLRELILFLIHRIK